MALRGKVVVVTGGAMGIGRYIARTFAAEGARLAIADISPMDTVADEVGRLGAEALLVRTDVREPEDVRSLMEQVHRRYGRIDVLINDAAIVTHFQWGLPRWPSVRDMEPSFFENVIRTNLIGTFHCTKYVLPYMEAARFGHIINLGQGSVGPPRGEPSIGACVYHVSKVAIRSFTMEVAQEEREFNICIVSMGPGSGAGGGIATEEAPEEARKRMKGVESVGDRYVLAAEAPMDLSGHQLVVEDGELAIARD